MSTASELLVDTGEISQGSPSQPPDGGITSSNLEGAISQGSPAAERHQKGPVAPWLQNVGDAELREFIQNKGWNDPGEMAQGYRNLEKLVGGEKVPLPKGDTDNEGWERVYKALGRPAKPEDYQLPHLESAQAYHKLGLTGRQATGLSAWQDTLQAAREQTAKDEAASQRAQQLAAVRKEWGVEFDENVRARETGGARVRSGRQRGEAGGGARLGRSAEADGQVGARTEGGQLCRGQRSGSGPDQRGRERGTDAVTEGQGIRDPLSGWRSRGGEEVHPVA
jgi:hypothetical protein